MKNGEVLFAIKEATPYMMWDYEKMFGENAACVGFPTTDGRGGHLLVSSDAYAIASVSEHKESAWAFIEDCLTQEKSELYAERWLTYPALKKTLDERVGAAIAKDRFTWDDVNVALKLVPDATPFFAVDDDEILQIKKTARLGEIIALQNELSARSNERDEGKVFEVLVEGPSRRSDRQLCGRTSQNKMVVFDPAGELVPGDYVRVRITGSTSATLFGVAE